MSSCLSLLLAARGVLRGGCLQTSSVWLFPAVFLHFGGGLPSVGHSTVAAGQENSGIPGASGAGMM